MIKRDEVFFGSRNQCLPSTPHKSSPNPPIDSRKPARLEGGPSFPPSLEDLIRGISVSSDSVRELAVRVVSSPQQTSLFRLPDGPK